ncbi:MAG: hypothetical protein A2234_00185 [Elusimicrobia bacterium RIFOXYA2_FULL_58_8]|nr:MAG: hypothetical protein A2234_00185 [Elusimicrobia bacterium RIFOXYA2_FULL_58_8]
MSGIVSPYFPAKKTAGAFIVPRSKNRCAWPGRVRRKEDRLILSHILRKSTRKVNAQNYIRP